MDSLSIAKGYGKVEQIETQTTHQRTTQKPFVLATAVALVIGLTIVLAALLGALIHESNTEPPESPPSASRNPAESIRAVCNVTQYPDSCFSSLSSATVNSPSKPDPELLFVLSLRIAADELSMLSSQSKKWASMVNDPQTVSALQDCVGLLEEALSRLKDSYSEVEVRPGETMLTEAKIGNVKTWISGAMTDQETCLDGLEEMRSTVLDKVKGAAHKSREYLSNSLAILANMQSLLHKFGLTPH